MLKIGHTVTVPGSLNGSMTDSQAYSIPIPEELETVPGHPEDPETVNYYTRNYPLESENIINFAWISWSVKNGDMNEAFHDHLRQDRPIVVAARASGDVEPQVAPVPGKDVSDEIKQKALELGAGMVGITAYDHRYTLKHKRGWVKPYGNAICLAVEQPYEETQMIPSEASEVAVLATYRRGGSLALKLAEYINSLGYHAQVHNFTDAAAIIIPMFVAAGMGQQGAMGYLLSPHFGSRHRLTMVTTDALVTHDKPVDYGINSFCEVCQVCVNRCPGRALMRDKIWWRGVEKFKIVSKRCRPVMSRYTQCAICMKVCPVQRYGLQTVMDHYANTGQVLGKGTHELEGYELNDLGYFGPGELPRFDADFFNVPVGTAEGSLLDDLKGKIQSGMVPEGPEGDRIFQEFRDNMEAAVKGGGDAMESEWYALEAGE